MSSNQFLYVYSCDLDANVAVKIGSLEGKLDKPTFDELSRDPSLEHCVALQRQGGDGVHHPPQDLFVTCSVFCDSKAVGFPVSTSYKCLKSRWNWNEWLILPVKYNELSRDAQLAVSVWDLHDGVEPHCVGGTTVALFSKRGVFRCGIIDLRVWPFREADGTVPTSTPGKVKAHPNGVERTLDDDDGSPEMRRLSKLSKKHRAGLIEKVDWLDRLTFREIETINEREKRQTRSLFLMLEFPRVFADNVDHVIVYYERNGDELFYHKLYPSLVTCPDPEIGLENLVEAKHHVLTRSARSGAVDRELKPNAIARDALERAVQAPSSRQLSSEQRDLIWKFRFYLSGNKKALTKFLRSVNWDEEQEARQATELLKEWAPIDSEDALELLSPTFTHTSVRRYAVSRLMHAAPEDLLLYLLQLVQALKYENFSCIESGTDASFIQDITASSMSQDTPRVSRDEEVSAEFNEEQEAALAELMIEESALDTSATADEGENTTADGLPDLASFLIKSACKDAALANYLYWYLKVEVDSYHWRDTTAAGGAQPNPEQANMRIMYSTVLRRLTRALGRGGLEAKRRATLLVRQQQFVNRLVEAMKAVAKESGNRKKKIEFLKSRLAAHDKVLDLSNLDGLPLPLDPSVRVQAVLADRASLFNSNLMPCKLTFRTSDNRHYVTMFKRGDDLRQDQLVIQMIRLMDKLLRAENLDLRLTPYQVLATSVQDGFVQFVDGVPLRDVIAEWSSIQEMFRFYRPSASGPYGVEADVIDNYVRSCAGYSVMCYLMGIGDRHQHNLLLCQNGRLFHVDFGYILGRDPKPLPPPMKLTAEMVNGMGGLASVHWQEFRRLCYTAFLHLRRHANVVLNLFSLMLDAGIPDIALEPDKAVKKIEERFHLNLSDEEAVHHMQYLIDTSTSAKMPVLVDWMHDVKQMMGN